MKKNDFFYLLLGVSYACLKASEGYSSCPISINFIYDVYLNSSFDETNPSLKFYPEDTDKVFYKLRDYEVVDLLHREDKIPIWIDIQVSTFEDQFLTFKLTCSSYYSEDKRSFYYVERGSGPFGIKISE